MASTKKLKIVLVGVFAAFLLVWLIAGSLSAAPGRVVVGAENVPSILQDTDQDDYMGSESCKDCHEDQFKVFSDSKHANLAHVESWKGKVQGCESCHGPGKEHMEGGGDITKIISFKNKTSKEISESCLSCHAGKENHNNYRRGEHWRNDVGCTDCHSAHGAQEANFMAGSATLVGESSKQNPTAPAMLKQSEPQLCISCHTETRAQFMKPFHHKVLEGTMKCSDCHNAHGGFESKQTKLSVGSDASCIKCHSNKQGPFVFEHAPLKVEGCATCHSPHGSNNPKLLVRSSVRQLCMECHTSITESLAPGTPSFHNQATVRYRDCTVCHSAIHGSNSNKDFFR